MPKLTPLSGFPEWLPAQRLAEREVLARFADTFERHGFAPVETRAVEPLDTLLTKGEVDKEVYVLHRLHGEPGDEDARLGLHFDLTVPLARYVLEHAGRLHFPFRRYQIQKVWRGERPQEGRFREFLQADVDVIGRDTLGFHHEVELPLVAAEALARLPLPGAGPRFRVQVANRKVAQGFYRGIGVADVLPVLRAVDKLDKVGPDAVTRALVAAGCTDVQAKACLEFAAISAPDASFADRVQALGASDPLLDAGLEELVRVIDAAREYAPGLVVVDLRIARGLDYYTGTVYETVLTGHESLGSICSGGRYDALATDGATTYPGVGISIGVTRLLSRLFGAGLLGVSRPVPTCVLVALPDAASRPQCDRIAAALRGRGIATEVAPDPAKYGRQIRYAERRGIPFVWFPQPDGGSEVRDIRSGEQVPADPHAWEPPSADLHPVLVGAAADGEAAADARAAADERGAADEGDATR